MSEQYHVITTAAEIEELKSYLKDKDYVAFDTETTGLTKDSVIIGFSVCAEVEKGYYVALYEWKEGQLLPIVPRSTAIEFMEILSSKRLIMHNAVFDCKMVKDNFSVDLMPAVHTDTLALGHLLNENRSNGLKERGVELFGENAKKEQEEMVASIIANNGKATKTNYELYKADYKLIGRYAAKDAILTLKLFYHDVEDLYEQGLDSFFYEEETMPLLRGPTYELNTTGLRIDQARLKSLKAELEADILQAKSYVMTEIEKYIKDEYPATNKKNTFNLNSTTQLAWLLFIKLDNEFTTLTDVGKEVCKSLGLKLPYTKGAKNDFIKIVNASKGEAYRPAHKDVLKNKEIKAKLINDSWTYLKCDEEALSKYSKKYKWVEKILEYKKNQKILNTYVCGLEEGAFYNVIYPSFNQSGTTSGRYSSSNPNFQNLPREDKRVKSCIVSRWGSVFVGADFSQLEPRVFASISRDEKLILSFYSNDDFYSTIAQPIFDLFGYSLKKDDPNSLAKAYPDQRQISKTISLAATYGANAPQLAKSTGKSIDETQEIIDAYFEKFPKVREMMLKAHEEAKTTGKVVTIFGRPRRMPEALKIKKLFGNTSHKDLPYEYRSLLNLAVNHKIQSTGASIMNRAAIAIYNYKTELAKEDNLWESVKIIMQVHDEIILEGPEELSDSMVLLLKECMENTVTLPDVSLIAEPKVAKKLSDLK